MWGISIYWKALEDPPGYIGWGGPLSGAGGGGCGWNCSDVSLVNMMLMPSIMERRTPPTMADPSIAGAPFLTDKMAPVTAPETIEFQGSSFCRK